VVSVLFHVKLCKPDPYVPCFKPNNAIFEDGLYDIVVGEIVGSELGANDTVGEEVGLTMGRPLGIQDGALVGDTLGLTVGARDGTDDGVTLGDLLGVTVGNNVAAGDILGAVDGLQVGEVVG
jgi:hypothetical protein